MVQKRIPFTADTPIENVIRNPVFKNYGRLLFPLEKWYYSGSTLKQLRLVWYNNMDPEETVEIVNTLWQRVSGGETVFYNIYTQEEKAADPEKEDTGLFFFKGKPGKIRRVQCRRRLCLCGGHAGQFPPRFGTLQERV